MLDGHRYSRADYLGARAPTPPCGLNRKRILNASAVPHYVIRKNFTSTVYLPLTAIGELTVLVTRAKRLMGRTVPIHDT
jgi:hypothetical protein